MNDTDLQRRHTLRWDALGTLGVLVTIIVATLRLTGYI